MTCILTLKALGRGRGAGDLRSSEATFVHHVLSSSRRNVAALVKMFYKVTGASSSIRKQKSLQLCEPCTCRCDVKASYYKQK